MPLIDLPGFPAVNVARTGPRGGPPLVFLHAVGLDSTFWDGQFEAFGPDRDVVAVDMPGHGLSGPLAGPPSFERMAEVVQGVIAHLGGGPADVVGISFGGMVAQALALQAPGQVRSLALVATLCTFAAPVREALRERARVARGEGMARIAQLSNARWFPQAFRERRPDVPDRTTQSLLRQDPAFHAALWEMISTLDLAPRLPRIPCPTLVVAGAEDGNAPVAAARAIAERIAGARVVEMAGVGHFPPFEATRAFNALLRGFLDGPPGVSPA